MNFKVGCRSLSNCVCPSRRSAVVTRAVVPCTPLPAPLSNHRRSSFQRLLLCGPERQRARCNAVSNDSSKAVPADSDERLAEWKPLPKWGMSSEEAIRLVGMGLWRMKGYVAPPIETMVAYVEGYIRHVLQGEVQIELPPWRYRYLDSLDPEGELQSLAHTLEDPPKGSAQYPRLMVENRFYKSRVFRSIHLEVAYRQDGLQVFHCVFYPRTNFDFPILAMDLVGTGEGRVSLAIIDNCPVSRDRSIPPHLAQAMQSLQTRMGVSTNRNLPEWGEAIFSQHCVCMRPKDKEESLHFVRYAVALTKATLEFSRLLQPVSPNMPGRIRDIDEGQRRFCDRQMENKKTMRVLEAAFGPEFVEEYMREIMFPYPGVEEREAPPLDPEVEDMMKQGIWPDGASAYSDMFEGRVDEQGKEWWEENEEVEELFKEDVAEEELFQEDAEAEQSRRDAAAAS